MKKNLLIPLILLVAVLASQLSFGADLLISGGVSYGTNFTDTRKLKSGVFNAHLYPYSGLNWLGASYFCRWDSYSLDVMEPFAISKDWTSYSVGPVFRLPKKRFEPWVAPAVIFYSETTDATLFGESILNEKLSKKTVSLGSGVNIYVWRGLTVTPSVAIEGRSRPVWKTSVTIGWKF